MTPSANTRDLQWSPHDSDLWGVTWSTSLLRCDTEEQEVTSRELTFSPTSFSWDPKSRRIAVSAENHSVFLVDIDGHAPNKQLHGHVDRVLCVAWHPDGTRIASGGRDRTVRIWDVESGAELLSLSHDEDVGSVAWSPNGRMLASQSEDGTVKIWDASTAR